MIPSIGRIFCAAFCVAATFLAVQVHGQEAVPSSANLDAHAARIIFKFDRPVAGVVVPHYTIELRKDGTGSYSAELPPSQGEVQKVERSLTFTPATVKAAFAVDTKEPCTSSLKHVADTGTKTLTRRDPKLGIDLVCTYNYTENKAVMQLTNLFLGIETTLEAGRALDYKRRFDRLGLDAEMSALNDSVESGRALELENIAPTLRSIAADMDVIQRVRLRAAKLLERIKEDAPTAKESRLVSVEEPSANTGR